MSHLRVYVRVQRKSVQTACALPAFTASCRRPRTFYTIEPLQLLPFGPPNRYTATPPILLEIKQKLSLSWHSSPDNYTGEACSIATRITMTQTFQEHLLQQCWKHSKPAPEQKRNDLEDCLKQNQCSDRENSPKPARGKQKHGFALNTLLHGNHKKAPQTCNRVLRKQYLKETSSGFCINNHTS